MAKGKSKAIDYLGGETGSNTGSKASAKINSGVSSVISDKNTKSLPSIIWSFRNGRTDSIGYDDPTFFGFAMDIHSQAPEASTIFNPYTGLRANPLFYQPAWANLPADGSGIMQPNDSDGKFKELTGDPSEACAIQYLSSFSLTLDKTKDYTVAKGPLLKDSADTLMEDILKKEYGGIDKLTRGYYLMDFMKTLNYIQEKTPWLIKEIDGINGLWKATQPKHTFAPVELTFTVDETVDLRMTKLANSYRLATYDSFNDRKVIAPNLEKFSMDIYIMDTRFIKNANGGGAISVGEATYDDSFSAQVNFGGIAFRCMGCRFDFSGYFEQTTAYKSQTPESGFQPKFKIIVDRVIPATYFGDKSFGMTGFTDELGGDVVGLFGNALGGSLDLGPFTGGITRVLSAGKRALTNILGTPQRALNDALLGIERKFDSYIDGVLGKNGLDSRPFEKWSPTDLATVQKERGALPISSDPYPTVLQQIQQRKAGGKLTADMFPGKDTRTTLPIKKDTFPGKDDRTQLPISNDVFPGESTQPVGKIKTDMFPGDVPIMNLVNQRKAGGKITSQNPFK